MGTILLISASGLDARAGSITINVYPWLAPNVYGSPNFNQAALNADAAILDGSLVGGTVGTPTYVQLGNGSLNVNSAQVVVTGFPSWMGVADPSSAFGAPFANEYGNRMHFAFLAVGNGMKLSASQISFVMASTDPSHGLNYSYPSGYTYTSQLQGIDFGGNGVLGGGDDTYITSGLATQLVDAIVYRGSGNSFAAYCSSCSTVEQQAAIDSVAAYPGAPFDFQGTYTIDGYMGTGTFHISPVPEPSSMTILPVGLLMLFGADFIRRHRKKFLRRRT